jgi:Ca-activated chloride channel family protein
VLPGQVRYYKVRLGWGQQLTYAAQFANEQAGSDSSAGGTVFTFVTTSLYAPGRVPVEDASDTPGNRTYDGSAPASVGLGTVPVTWTNRWVAGGAATEVHRAGDYWIAVGLGPDAAKIAPDTAVGVVLRIRVSGAELAGPQYRAPVLAGQSGTGDTADAKAGTSAGATSGAPSGSPAGSLSGVQADGSAESGGSGGSGGGPLGITGTDLLAAGTGGAVALAGLAVAVLVHRARTRTRTDRGGV